MESSPVTRKPPPSLVKWPFFLGDILLLGLVVFVLLRAGEALNSWQIAFCVLGVVVGAVLLVAPFVIEFYLKQKLHEAAEAEAVETILRRINVAVGEVMDLHRNQKGDFNQLEHTLAAYEGLSGILDQKAEKLQTQTESIAQLESRLQQWGDAFKGLEKRLEDGLSFKAESAESLIEKTIQSIPEPDFEKGLAPWKSTYREDFKHMEDKLKHLESSIGGIRDRVQDLADRLSENASDKENESNLDSKLDSAPESPHKEPTAVEEEEGIPEPPANVTVEEQQGDLLPAERRMLDKAMGRVEAKRPSNPLAPVNQIINSATSLNKEEDESTSEMETENASEEAGASQLVVLEANILIGIGNKLYLRGEGGGLSWEEGKPLEFVEIGLYRWTSEPVSGVVEAQLYLNDEISALGDSVKLNPGESLQITPEFPE